MMFVLTVLLLIAVLLTIISSSGRMRAEAASRKLSNAIENITKLEQAEAALERQRSELARSNAELTAANKELEAFSYSVSHDLRAPLRSIDGFSQALLEDYAEKLDAGARNHLQRVRHAAQRMSVLIDDMLTLSRVTRSPIHHENLDLSVIARSIAEDLRREEPARKVVFAVEEGLTATGDSQLLRVALENLLRNSWKYTSGHESAKIEFGRNPSRTVSPLSLCGTMEQASTRAMRTACSERSSACTPRRSFPARASAWQRFSESSAGMVAKSGRRKRRERRDVLLHTLRTMIGNQGRLLRAPGTRPVMARLCNACWVPGPCTITLPNTTRPNLLTLV